MNGPKNNVDLLFTPVADIPRLVQECKDAWVVGDANTIQRRKELLRTLNKLVVNEADAIKAALHNDLRKPSLESSLYELSFVQDEIAIAIDNLAKWTAKEKASGVPLANKAEDLFTIKEPLGTVLIIGPWNFPFQLLLCPLVGALAAGNTAVLKPSEVTPSVASLLAEIVPKYFPKKEVVVINGAVEETTALLKEKFDKILYTGNGAVGKIVMRAAAEHLTPVILELGGKSPVYVSDDIDPALAATRLVWGKTVNAGQICVAPDYVLCSPKMQEALLVEMKAALTKFYGEDQQKSNSYSRIVNRRHFERVRKLVDGAQNKIAIGGRYDEDDLFIEFTALQNVTVQDEVMKDEIFGPVLPIVPVSSIDEAIKIIRAGDKPLAMYAFTSDDKVVQKLLSNTSSGSVCVNDCIMQIATHLLPFGGVGPSGTGSYHGKYSFDSFSHTRSVVYKSAMLEKHVVERVVGARYPPYTESNENFLKRLVSRKVKMTDGGFFG